MKNICFAILLLICLSFLSCSKPEQISPVQNSNPSNNTPEPEPVDPLANFNGYKVSENAKVLGTDYWENTNVLMDLMVVGFQTPVGTRNRYNTFLIQMTCGDFNNDGWIDIFNPGASYNGVQGSLTFLIWNASKKIFEEQNLFNDKTILNFDGNKVKTIPIYLNEDDFVDMILFTAEDEGDFYYNPKKLKILISDGKGKYDVVEFSHLNPEISATNGDAGDLNGDNIPDLVLIYGSAFKILWGKSTSPYFTVEEFPMFSFPIVNLIGGKIVNFKNDNGFGEICDICIENQLGDVSIKDINNDGWNDLVLQQPELNDTENKNYSTKILLNLGEGRFNNSGIIRLPKYDETSNEIFSQEDYQFEDLNGDGRIDIIALNHMDYKSWNIYVYLQNSSGGFEINKDWIKYTINSDRIIKYGNWKSQLIFTDFNNDGLKDITYLDAGDNGETKVKSVFIRRGNQFVEEDIYQYDPYAKSVMQNISY